MFEVKEFGWKIDPPCGCGQAETGGLGHVTPSPVSIYVQSMVYVTGFGDSAGGDLGMEAGTQLSDLPVQLLSGTKNHKTR